MGLTSLFFTRMVTDAVKITLSSIDFGRFSFIDILRNNHIVCVNIRVIDYLIDLCYTRFNGGEITVPSVILQTIVSLF